jgi:hypothetical protein
MRRTRCYGFTLVFMPFWVVDDFGNQVAPIDYAMIWSRP